MATADYAREYRKRPATKMEVELQERRHRAEIAALEAQLRVHQEWPLLAGYRAAKDGQAFDRTKPADWQRGYWTAAEAKKTADRAVNGRKAKR